MVRKYAGVFGWCLAGAVTLIGVGTLGGGPWLSQLARADAPAGSKDQAGDAQSPQATLLKSYLAVQQLLAHDKFDGVGAELKKVRESAAALANQAGDAKVKEPADAVAKAAGAEPKDLKDARAAFRPLSSAVIDLLQTVPPAPAVGTLYEASCPMAKASWLQASKDVANPYMGKAMTDCGKVERTIEPAQRP